MSKKTKAKRKRVIIYFVLSILLFAVLISILPPLNFKPTGSVPATDSYVGTTWRFKQDITNRKIYDYISLILEKTDKDNVYFDLKFNLNDSSRSFDGISFDLIGNTVEIYFKLGGYREFVSSGSDKDVLYPFYDSDHEPYTLTILEEPSEMFVNFINEFMVMVTPEFSFEEVYITRTDVTTSDIYNFVVSFPFYNGDRYGVGAHDVTIIDIDFYIDSELSEYNSTKFEKVLVGYWRKDNVPSNSCVYAITEDGEAVPLYVYSNGEGFAVIKSFILADDDISEDAQRFLDLMATQRYYN